MIALQKVTVSSGNFTLREIDMQIRAGTCHALLGPSGSGKSTLVQALLGLKTPQSGLILRDGEDITMLATEKRGFGYVPQHLALFPHLSVEENLRYGIKARKLSRKETEPLLQELIELTGIGKLLTRMPDTLSGGERQRVALVRALAPRPRLLLLDEPFSALDLSLKRDLWMLVKRLQNEYGTTMLLITHDLDEASFLASRISVIIDGMIAQSGSREALFERPVNEAVARYLGIRNIFDATCLHTGEGVVVAEVPVLGTSLEIATQRRCQAGERVKLAIRGEEVLCDSAEDHNRLEGEIEWLPMGSRMLGLFTPDGASQTLELQRAFAGGNEAQKRVAVTLPKEKIVILEG
jgi:ABC-type Fe3+/spermidine/putrescine transport system ATPase subunit